MLRPRAWIAITAATLSLGSSQRAWAKVYKTTQAFLTELGSGCAQKPETLYLAQSVVVRHRLDCQGSTRWVYFDSHRVRTQPETLAVVVRQDGSLDQVKVLSFDEPEEYLPKSKWHETFHGKTLDSKLALHRDIPMITGATLSARSATDAVRRILSVHETVGGTPGRAKP